MFMRRLLTGAMLIIPMGFLLLTFVIPAIDLFRISLLDEWPSADSLLSGEHYVRAVSSGYVRDRLFGSLQLSVVVTLVTLVVAYPVAAGMRLVGATLRRIIFTTMFTTLLISVVVRALGWSILLGPSGLLNNFLLSIGLITSPLPLMDNFWTVVVGYVHVLLPFMVFPIASALEKIPMNLQEASRSLGASSTYTFLNVTLPLSRPGVAAGCALTFCLTIGSYATVAVLGGGRVKNLALDVYQQVALGVPEYPYASAVAGTLFVTAGFCLALYFGSVEFRNRSRDHRRGSQYTMMEISQ